MCAWPSWPEPLSGPLSQALERGEAPPRRDLVFRYPIIFVAEPTGAYRRLKSQRSLFHLFREMAADPLAEPYSASTSTTASASQAMVPRNLRGLFAGDHGRRFAGSDYPVPCTVCRVGFANRAEQVAHYKSQAHVDALRAKFSHLWGYNYCKPDPLDVGYEYETQEIIVDLDVEVPRGLGPAAKGEDSGEAGGSESSRSAGSRGSVEHVAKGCQGDALRDPVLPPDSQIDEAVGRALRAARRAERGRERRRQALVAATSYTETEATRALSGAGWGNEADEGGEGEGRGKRGNGSRNAGAGKSGSTVRNSGPRVPGSAGPAGPGSARNAGGPPVDSIMDQESSQLSCASHASALTDASAVSGVSGVSGLSTGSTLYYGRQAPGVVRVFRCATCEQTFMKESGLVAHLQTRKHAKNVERALAAERPGRTRSREREEQPDGVRDGEGEREAGEVGGVGEADEEVE